MAITQPKIQKILGRLGSTVIYRCRFRICNNISHINNTFYYSLQPHYLRRIFWCLTQLQGRSGWYFCMGSKLIDVSESPNVNSAGSIYLNHNSAHYEHILNCNSNLLIILYFALYELFPLRLTNIAYLEQKFAE